MNETSNYTEFHPRWYRAKVSTYWWLERWSWMRFILRELTSVPVAWFVVLTLLQLRALGRGPQAYAEFQEWLTNPVVLGLNILSFVGVVFHAITWFGLAPKALVLSAAGRRVPDWLVTASHYLAWLLISAGVARVLAGG